MSILAPDLEGARVLDLFAGSGALGIEALSRGAAHVTFVESDPRVLRVLRANLDTLGAGPEAQAVRADGIRLLHETEPGRYDLVFADPPYGRGLAGETLRVFRTSRAAPILALEHHRDEAVDPPPDATRRVYGDTVLLFVRHDVTRKEA